MCMSLVIHMTHDISNRFPACCVYMSVCEGGPSRIHRCPCFLTRTCEKSILAEVGITQASFVPEVIKTFDQLLDLLLQKVTPHNRPVAMQTEREPTPPQPIDEFCSLRCDVHMVSHKQCTVAPESTTKKYSGQHWCNSEGRPTGTTITSSCSSLLEEGSAMYIADESEAVVSPPCSSP